MPKRSSRVWFLHYNTVHRHWVLGYRSPREFICKSLDLTHRSLSDFAIHLTADIIGEAESML